MLDTNEQIYTEAQYNSLTPEEQETLQQVAIHLTSERITVTDDETLQSTFNVLRPCEGCIPDEEIGDDLLADIRRKFACVYYTATERAENQLKARGLRFYDDLSLCLVIDPCYENSTHVAVVDLRPDVRPFCYFHEYTKAWHFSFPSLKDIAQEVGRAEKMILATFLRLRKQHPTERRKAMSDSKTYHVLWEIDLAAESAKDAAEQALSIHRDPDSTATVFDVTDADGNAQRIDLDGLDARDTCAACGREFDEHESIIQAPTGKTYCRECFDQGQG